MSLNFLCPISSMRKSTFDEVLIIYLSNYVVILISKGVFPLIIRQLNRPWTMNLENNKRGDWKKMIIKGGLLKKYYILSSSFHQGYLKSRFPPIKWNPKLLYCMDEYDWRFDLFFFTTFYFLYFQVSKQATCAVS